MRPIDADALVQKMNERAEELNDDRALWESSAVEVALDMFAPTISAVLIPEGATNGDAVRAMFPNADYVEGHSLVHIYPPFEGTHIVFTITPST